MSGYMAGLSAAALHTDDKSALAGSPSSSTSRDSSDSRSSYTEDLEAHGAYPLLEKEDLPSSALREDELRGAADAPPVEYTVPTGVKLFYLGVYFLLNLTLTLYNKAILGHFAFPWLMTAIHCTAVTIGCYGLQAAGVFKLTKLTRRENLILVAFSFLFTVNIAISNVSLALVSVPMHQILRSTGPLFMVVAYRCFYGRSYSGLTYLSLIPIMGGVALATYGDYYSTLIGFSTTILGVMLAVAKSMISNRIMTGSLKLSAYEVLLRMSPLAAVQSLMYCMLTGESTRIRHFALEGGLTNHLLIALAGNGLVAFGLNIASFQTNKMAGALTLTVAANIKQCFTILLGIFLFNVEVGLLNTIGMVVTIAGAGWYSKVELDAKGRGR